MIASCEVKSSPVAAFRKSSNVHLCHKNKEDIFPLSDFCALGLNCLRESYWECGFKGSRKARSSWHWACGAHSRLHRQLFVFHSFTVAVTRQKLQNLFIWPARSPQHMNGWIEIPQTLNSHPHCKKIFWLSSICLTVHGKYLNILKTKFFYLKGSSSSKMYILYISGFAVCSKKHESVFVQKVQCQGLPGCCQCMWCFQRVAIGSLTYPQIFIRLYSCI